ncbi:MAG: hypothetical protein ACKO7A_10040, partial [Microcystis sp.]
AVPWITVACVVMIFYRSRGNSSKFKTEMLTTRNERKPASVNRCYPDENAQCLLSSRTFWTNLIDSLSGFDIILFPRFADGITVIGKIV